MSPPGTTFPPDLALPHVPAPPGETGVPPGEGCYECDVGDLNGLPLTRRAQAARARAQAARARTARAQADGRPLQLRHKRAAQSDQVQRLIPEFHSGLQNLQRAGGVVAF